MSKFDLSAEKPLPSHFQPRLDDLMVFDAWSSWNGYKLAEYFYDAELEYFSVRNFCGTYDMCAMQKYIISGQDALAMLNRMVTRDVSKIRLNRVGYAVWCDDSGRLIDDGTIFRLADDKFMLTCGSPCTAWLKMSSVGFGDLQIVDVSDDIAALAVQGPTSCAVLKKMGLAGVEEIKPFGIRTFDFGQGELTVSRTGFTGDLGYELWITSGLALEMWDVLYKAGADSGIHPIGEQALNMARIEAGFIMPGYEFNEALKTVHFEHDQTPFELNLGWLVDFRKPHFNGRAALLKESRRGPRYTLVKLDIEGNKPADESFIYDSQSCTHHIGYVTSALWSPVVKANIALAMIETPFLEGELWAEINYAKELRHYSKIARCKLQEQPFWAPPHAKATPPADY